MIFIPFTFYLIRTGINRRIDEYNRNVDRQLIAASTLAVTSPVIIPSAVFAFGYLFRDQIGAIIRKYLYTLT